MFFSFIFTLFNWKIAIQAVENRSKGRADLAIDEFFGFQLKSDSKFVRVQVRFVLKLRALCDIENQNIFYISIG